MAACATLAACSSGSATDATTPTGAAPNATLSAVVSASPSGAPSASSRIPDLGPAEQLARVTTAVVVAAITNAWAVEGAVLVASQDDRSRKLARLDGDRLVDESDLSRGLPVPASSVTMGGHAATDFVGGILGRYPDSLVMGLTMPTGFGHATMLRYDPATGWAMIASAPAMALDVDPALSLGIGALFADVNLVGDRTTSPTGLLLPGPKGYAVDMFAAAKPVRQCFDHGGGGVFLSRAPKGNPVVWTLTDDTESARGVLRKDGVVVPEKLDVPGALREPLFVRSTGQIVAGFVPREPSDESVGGRLIAVCDAGVCHTLEPVPERLVELRELGGSLLALEGKGLVNGIGSGDVVVYEDHAWRRVAMPATHPRVKHFLTLDDGSSTLLVLAEGADRSTAIVRLHAR